MQIYPFPNWKRSRSLSLWLDFLLKLFFFLFAHFIDCNIAFQNRLICKRQEKKLICRITANWFELPFSEAALQSSSLAWWLFRFLFARCTFRSMKRKNVMIQLQRNARWLKHSEFYRRFQCEGSEIEWYKGFSLNTNKQMKIFNWMHVNNWGQEWISLHINQNPNLVFDTNEFRLSNFFAIHLLNYRVLTILFCVFFFLIRKKTFFQQWFLSIRTPIIAQTFIMATLQQRFFMHIHINKHTHT